MTMPENRWFSLAAKVALHGLLYGFAAVMLGGCNTYTYNRMDLDARDPQLMRYARNGDLKAEVDSLAQPLIDNKQTPGMVVGVLLPDGSRHFYGYGATALVAGSKPDGSTLFAIGSVSKVFLGAITARLVQDGKLSWGDSLEKLLPANTPLSDDAKKITILRLATHTSGLPRQPLTLQTLRYFIQYLFTGESFYRHFDRAFLLKYLADFDAPNTIREQYSSMGYALMGYALEIRSGKKVDDLLREYIVNPLGLKNTGYTPENLPGFADRAHGYTGDQPKFKRRGQPTPDWNFTDIMRGAAGLYSNGEDLLTYASAHLHPGNNQVLHTALQDTLVARFDQLKPAPAIAWSIDELNGLKITRHLGFVAGYSTYLGLDVKHRTAVVVLQNSFDWTVSVGPQLLLRLAAVQEQTPE